MPYKIPSTMAEEVSSPVFRLKRNWEGLKSLRKLVDNGPLPLNDDTDTIQDAAVLGPTHQIIQTEPLDEITDCASDLESEAESLASEDSEPQITRRKEDSMTYSVNHPWKIVDYHLYLCSVERGKDTNARRNGMFVYDGIDCRPMSYSELLENQAFDACNVGDDPQFLFVALPIADFGPEFQGRHYVLGFDYNNKTLFARHFDWIPSKTDDLWSIWDHGFTMYSVAIADLLSLLESSLAEGSPVNMGFLSSSPYCMAFGMDDDPGMEIVIAILFCQWMLDFADAILQPDRETLDKYKDRLAYYMDECRIILQRASYRAWFASRDGYTREKYTRNSSVNKFINDLYTFDKSMDSGSLRGQSWKAPGLETCHKLRHKDRVHRKEQTEKRLQNLFTIPEVNSPTVAQDQAFERKLTRGEISLGTTYHISSEGLKTPIAVNAVGQQYMDVTSPMIDPSTSRAAHREFEGNEYQRVPLALLLTRALELIETRPELDTMGNRGHIGALLQEIQAGMRPAALRLGTEADGKEWKLQAPLRRNPRRVALASSWR